MPITGIGATAATDSVAALVAALGSVRASLTERGSWVTATSYAVGDVVTQAGQRYACRTAHTSGTFAADLSASKWVSLDAVAGLAASSNLSDLGSASTARTNLGLGAAATMSTAQVAADSALTSVFGKLAGSNTWTGSQDFTGATVSGISGGATFTWTATKTANYTAITGDAVPVNAVGGSVTVTLPASPSAGDRVRVLRTDTTPITAAVTVTGTGVSDVIPASTPTDYLYTGAKWVRQQPLSDAALIKPTSFTQSGNTASQYDVVGLYPKRKKIDHSVVTKLALFTTTGSLSASTAATADTVEPGNPAGSILLTGTSFTTAEARKAITATDLSSSIIRARVRLSTSGAASRAGLNICRIELSSDGFTSGNSHGFTLNARSEYMLADDCWEFGGAHINEFAVSGTGANLTAINSIRFRLARDSGGTVFMSVAFVEALPVVATKAKCVLWFDDGYTSHWTNTAALLEQYGWAGVAAVEPAQADAMTAAQLRHLQEGYGWQIATHAYSSSLHGSLTGDQLRMAMNQSKALQAAFGLWGGDDMAWWGGLGISVDAYAAVKSHFRTGRYFLNQVRMVETLPPLSDHRTLAYGQTTADDSSFTAMQAYIDKAIAQKGLAQIVWHNQSSTSASLTSALTYLDSQRANIDVVTLDQALAPYTSWA